MLDFFDELLSQKKENSLAPGIVSGIVLENNNKEYPGMVKVEYMVGQAGQNKSSWIPVSSWYAGNQYGAYFLPEIGTEVLIAFYMGNWDSPIVIGSRWNKQNPLPQNSFQEKNTVKMIQTKGGHQILFQGEEKKETITIKTPQGLQVHLDDEQGKIVLSDKDKKNLITVDSKNGSILLDADKSIECKIGNKTAIEVTKGKVAINADNIEIKGTQGVKISGQTLALKGTTAECKADSSLKLSTSGIAELKGSMVKIN